MRTTEIERTAEGLAYAARLEAYDTTDNDWQAAELLEAQAALADATAACSSLLALRLRNMARALRVASCPT